LIWPFLDTENLERLVKASGLDWTSRDRADLPATWSSGRHRSATVTPSTQAARMAEEGLEPDTRIMIGK